MSNKSKILIFISGRGSNFINLFKKADNYEIVKVISDNKNAAGNTFAVENKIPLKIFDKSDYPSRTEAKTALYKEARETFFDYAVLAGFMQIVPADFTDEFHGRIINIHPSLLPKFPGLHTHERAIEAREKIHGASVHYVDSGLDTGPVIAQVSCPVIPTDTPETLAARLLTFEHQLYPWVMNQLAAKNITLSKRHVSFSEDARNSARENNFILK